MNLFSRRAGPARRPERKARLVFDLLEDRMTPASTAVFNSGILTVIGDAANNALRVAADAAGNLQVTDNGSPVRIRVQSGAPVLGATDLVVLQGNAGNDTLVTDKSLNTSVNGSLTRAPSAVLMGGAGHDSLSVGHGGIVGGLAGVDANGNVVGQVVGNAFMDGGDGNDTLVSGFGNDIMLGGNGNDTYMWPPGTLTDSWDGGPGTDTAIITGNDTFLGVPANDVFQLTAAGEKVRFDRLNLVRFTVTIGLTENIVLRPGAGDDVVNILDLRGVRALRQVVVEAGDGNDTVNGSSQASAAIALVLNGGAGDDVLRGGAGRDVLNGDIGNDQLEGNGGMDVLFGGDGDDRLDGGRDGVADVLTGGRGADRFQGGRGRQEVFVDVLAAEGDVILTVPM